MWPKDYNFLTWNSAHDIKQEKVCDIMKKLQFSQNTEMLSVVEHFYELLSFSSTLMRNSNKRLHSYVWVHYNANDITWLSH